LCPIPAFDEAPHIDYPKYDEISLGHGNAYFVYSKNKKVTLYLKPDPDWIRFYTVWATSGRSTALHTSGEIMFDHVKFGISDYAVSKAFFLKAQGNWRAINAATLGFISITSEDVGPMTVAS
jgi:hypothetical protein